MPIATVHVAADDLQLSGSYEATGDVLYLSASGDEKTAAAQETPEGHAVRLDRRSRDARDRDQRSVAPRSAW